MCRFALAVTSSTPGTTCYVSERLPVGSADNQQGPKTNAWSGSSAHLSDTMSHFRKYWTNVDEIWYWVYTLNSSLKCNFGHLRVVPRLGTLETIHASTRLHGIANNYTRGQFHVLLYLMNQFKTDKMLSDLLRKAIVKKERSPVWLKENKTSLSPAASFEIILKW
jgi:hypothetical protein